MSFLCIHQLPTFQVRAVYWTFWVKKKKKKGRGESVLNNSGRLERQLEGMQNEGTGSAPQREARGESRTTIVKMKEMDVSERNRDIKQQ